MSPFNDRPESEKSRPLVHHNASTAPKNPNRGKQKPPPGPVDMEMYVRPQPDMRTDSYKDGYSAGWGGEPFQVKDMNYLAGFRDGQSDRAEEANLMDRTSSSNA